MIGIRPAVTVVVLAIAMLFGGCGHATIGDVPADQLEVSGSYILESVDGHELPATLAPDGECLPTIIQGELGLNVAMGETRPLYTWYAAGREMCGTSPTMEVRIGDDFGTWYRNASALHFESRRSTARYTGEIVGGGGPPSFLTFESGNHTYTFRHVRRSDTPRGYVEVTVLDQTDAWVNGAVLELLTADGLPTGGTTSYNRSFMTSGTPGMWVVTVTPPPGYVVPSEQPNPVEVSVTANEVAQVRFVLRRAPAG